MERLALTQVWGEKKRTTCASCPFLDSPHSIGVAEKLPSCRPFVLTTPAMTRPGPPAESRVACHGYVIGLVIGAPPICAWVVRGPASRHRAACESCALRAAQLSIDYESLSPLAVWPGRRRRRCTRQAPARPRRARSGAPPGKFMRVPDFLIVATQSRL